MSITTITELYVFILAGFLGYQLVTRVPPLLHTPLMSATNAICGISLVGALVEAGAHQSTVSTILGTVAVASAAVNVVGGFLMTDRMLSMFKRRPAPTAGTPAPGTSPQTSPSSTSTPASNAGRA
jgi:NAD(P) transhydrogenase subunit alpha